MRIIAGSQRGRRLLSPSQQRGIRPTSDRVREALFSILQPMILEARVLDLFAGTGAIGIEALSRGARHVTFVDTDPAVLQVLRRNLARCGQAASADIWNCAASAFHRRCAPTTLPYDLVFADPRYDSDDGKTALGELTQTSLIGPRSVLVLEHAWRRTAPEHFGRFSRQRQYRYGDTALSLYRMDSGGTPPL